MNKKIVSFKEKLNTWADSGQEIEKVESNNCYFLNKNVTVKPKKSIKTIFASSARDEDRDQFLTNYSV